MSVEGLSKSYGGVHAVRNVSFALKAGEILALIGPNGAGKSTCFDMLNGQTIPGSGRISLSGEDITGKHPHQIAVVAVSSGDAMCLQRALVLSGRVEPGHV